jgi:putative endonuclease
MQSHYVYIIKSVSNGLFYKGYSLDYIKRLEEHNAGLSEYTANRGPWVLVYVEIHHTKTAALKRELMLKRQNKKYLEWLLEQPTNILKK